MLVLAQALGHVVDRTSAVVGFGLELVERVGERIFRIRLERLAQPDRSDSLLVDRAPELGRLGLDLRLDVGDPLP